VVAQTFALRVADEPIDSHSIISIWLPFYQQ